MRYLLLFILFPSYSFAARNADIMQYSNSDGEIFSKITNLLNAYIEFLNGPFATMAIFTSLIIGLCTWIYAPKNGALGFFVRIFIGGIALLNVSTVISMLQNV